MSSLKTTLHPAARADRTIRASQRTTVQSMEIDRGEDQLRGHLDDVGFARRSPRAVARSLPPDRFASLRRSIPGVPESKTRRLIFECAASSFRAAFHFCGSPAA